MCFIFISTDILLCDWNELHFTSDIFTKFRGKHEHVIAHIKKIQMEINQVIHFGFFLFISNWQEFVLSKIVNARTCEYKYHGWCE